MTETAKARRALADRLEQAGALLSPQMRAAVEAVPRELFVSRGVFLPAGDGHWRPVSARDTDEHEWIEVAYRDESLVTQLDGHVMPDQVTKPVTGSPTSSSTDPALVVSMIEELALEDGQSVLEIGTGTGYSTALLCHRLGEDIA